MIDQGRGGDASEIDYVRRMVGNPPLADDPISHLAWLRIMAKVLMELDSWAPLFLTAACSVTRSDDLLRAYCRSGGFERSYFEHIPHALTFLDHYLQADHPAWIKDLARCEFWARCRSKGQPASVVSDHSGLHADEPPRLDPVGKVREIVGVEQERGLEYIRVSHDALETLQMLIGFADTSINRVGRYLWLLNVAPVHPVHQPSGSPGIVLFGDQDGTLSMSYAVP